MRLAGADVDRAMAKNFKVIKRSGPRAVAYDDGAASSVTRLPPPPPPSQANDGRAFIVASLMHDSKTQNKLNRPSGVCVFLSHSVLSAELVP